MWYNRPGLKNVPKIQKYGNQGISRKKFKKFLWCLF